MPPVGAMASGRLLGLPKMSTWVSTCATFTSTLRQQAHALEGGAVLAQRDLVLGAAVEEVEDRARQPAFRQPAQVLDVDGLLQGHNCGSTLPLKAKSVSRLFALAVAFLFALPAAAQNFPNKPMRIVVPFTPAGAVDIATRATANEMQKILGQPVAVENKPGAGGNLGVLDVARAAPDGYSMVMSTSGIQAINPALYAKMPLDPNKELAPVAPIVSLSNVLVVHPSVPARSVKEVIALARKDPGKWTYASSGNGTSIHMSGAMFTQITKTDILHIPYKGSAPAVTDLLGGQTHMMFDNIPSSLPHIKSGKLIALATTGAKRDPALPDLPTIAEAGVPGYESGVWFGIMVPAATPRDIIARLNAAAVQATKSPEFIKRMTDLGYNIIPGTPEDMAKMLDTELKRWAPIVKASGAKVD